MVRSAHGTQPTLQRAARIGLLIGVWGFAIYWLWFLTLQAGARGPAGWLGVDSFAYWYAGQRGLYEFDAVVPAGQMFGRYLYPPIVAQIIWPLAQLPWQAFAAVWSTIAAAIFIWLLRPLPWRWSVPAFVLLCLEEVLIGNVRSFIALALVLALRRPMWWAMPLLTKVASGVGILWHPLRREWRALATAVGFTGLLVAISMAIDMSAWRSWFDYMTSGEVTPPDGFSGAAVRWGISVVLVILAAKFDRPALLAPATALASPVIYLADLSYLAAIPRLAGWGQDRDEPVGPTSVGVSSDGQP